MYLNLNSLCNNMLDLLKIFLQYQNFQLMKAKLLLIYMYPIHNISSLARVSQTQAAKHRSVALRWDRTASPISGGRLCRSWNFVTALFGLLICSPCFSMSWILCRTCPIIYMTISLEVSQQQLIWKKISVNCYCTKQYRIKYDFVEQEVIDV